MKPKPFWLLNHFTVPVFMQMSFSLTVYTQGLATSFRGLFPGWSILERDLKRARPSVTRRSPVVRPSIDNGHIVVKWSYFKACGARRAKKAEAAALHSRTMSLLSLGLQQF